VHLLYEAKTKTTLLVPFFLFNIKLVYLSAYYVPNETVETGILFEKWLLLIIAKNYLPIIYLSGQIGTALPTETKV